MIISYYAIFEYAEDGINVTFPDVPNAVTCGFSKRHAKKMAKEVLSLVLHGTQKTDLPAKQKMARTVFSPHQSVECIRIRMKVVDDVLVGKHVTECNKRTSESGSE